MPQDGSVADALAVPITVGSILPVIGQVTISEGQLIVGAKQQVPAIVTLKLHSEVLPQSSVAVYVTVVVPEGKVAPLK